jgi:hypothetical protein
VNRRGENLLHMASGGPSPIVMSEFLQKGIELNSEANGRGPLHYAAQYCRLSNGRLLLDKGARIEAVDEDGCSPLYSAIDSEKAEFVQPLLEKGASVTMSTNRHGETLLGLAERIGNRKILDLLHQRQVQYPVAAGSASSITSKQRTSPSAGASSNTDSHAGPFLSSGGLSTGDGV